MSIDELLWKLPKDRQAKLRQQILALIDRSSVEPTESLGVIHLKRIRELKRNGPWVR